MIGKKTPNDRVLFGSPPSVPGRGGPLLCGSDQFFPQQSVAINESEENVLSNYVEGLAASGTEAEHGEMLVE
jgi:hypothetical protein